MSIRLGCFFFLIFLVGTHGWIAGASENNQGSHLRELVRDQYGGQQVSLVTKRSHSDNYLSQPIRVCGRRLISVLQLLCRAPHMAPLATRKKRQVDGGMDSLLMSAFEHTDESQLGHQTIQRHIVKRGITSDCCLDSCTLGHLKSFCPK